MEPKKVQGVLGWDPLKQVLRASLQKNAALEAETHPEGNRRGVWCPRYRYVSERRVRG